MRLAIVFMIFVISGCVPLIPVTAPPQLSHTPGTFITIDDHSVGTSAWRIGYPDGWRVVKISIAAEPVRIVFVSPDDRMLIEIAESAPADTTPEPDQVLFRDTLATTDLTLYLSASAPADMREALEGYYQLVQNSFQVRP